MTDWLEGKSALVVGAGSGIGRAVVNVFRSEGARVSVLERDKDKCQSLAETLPDVPVTVGDATCSADNDRAVSSALDSFGGLDILVSCVGIFDYYRSIEDLDPVLIDSAFDEVFHPNVKSMLHSVKAALPALHRADRGTILLTESTSSYYPGRGGILYLASKFAVRGLVTALAHDLAPAIRVNGVAPGGTVNTDLRGPESLGLSDRSLGAVPGREAELAARVPLQVALAAEDIAWSYVFLASDRAGGITGTTVHPDGGASIAAPRKRS